MTEGENPGKNETPLEHLRNLRTTWSDEIPKKIIHSDSGTKSKARKNWFTGVAADIETAMVENEINSPGAKDAAEKLLAIYESPAFINRKLTRKKDIQVFNDLIDIILGNQG